MLLVIVLPVTIFVPYTYKYIFRLFLICNFIFIVQAMVTHGRVELLAHPLSQKYLQMKWNAYGKYFHVTNLLIYMVFLAFVTIYASQLMQNVDQNSTTIQSTVSIPLNNSSSAVVSKSKGKKFFYRMKILKIFIFFCSIHSH